MMRIGFTGHAAGFAALWPCADPATIKAMPITSVRAGNFTLCHQFFEVSEDCLAWQSSRRPQFGADLFCNDTFNRE